MRLAKTIAFYSCAACVFLGSENGKADPCIPSGCCPSSGNNYCYVGSGNPNQYNLIQHPHIYISRWNYPAPDTQYTLIENYFGGVNAIDRGIGGSKYLNTLTQYSAGGYTIYNDTGILKGDTCIDSTAYPNNPLQPADINAAVLRAVGAAPCPNCTGCYSLASDPDAIVLLLTGTTRQNRGCRKYHASAPLFGSNPSVPYIDFDYIADLYNPDGTPACGAGWGVYAAPTFVHHELAETITNPRGPDTCDCASQRGWLDNFGHEVVDKCVDPWIIVYLDPTNTFLLPDIWSNESNRGSGACVFAYSTHEDWYVVGNCGGGTGLCQSSSLLIGSWTNYGTPSGVSLTSGGPGAVSWFNGRQDAFVKGSDGNLWQWRKGPGVPPGWWNWGKPPGTTIASGPDAFSWKPQREDVVVVAGSPAHFWKKAYDNGTWIDWQDLGGPPVSSINSRPGTASWGPNRFDIFYLSGESPPHIRHASSTNGTSITAWDDWGVQQNVTFYGSVDAASWGDQNVNVVVLGTDGNIWQKAWDHNFQGSWFNWGHFGECSWGVGAVGAGDGGVVLGGGRLDVTCLNTNSETFFDRGYDWGLGPWLEFSDSFPLNSTVDVSSW